MYGRLQYQPQVQVEPSLAELSDGTIVLRTMLLTPGTRLGPYEILAPIGAGGMGEVYKARDTRLDRLVAIKVSQAEFSERFEREARAVSALSHPNTCQLYDVGPNYLVMEFIEGSPLPTVENARKLLDLAVQTADGMAADHAAGIVHRDLKPDNILVTREGRDGQWISCIRQNNGQSKLANIRALPGASPVILADAEGVPATQRSQNPEKMSVSAVPARPAWVNHAGQFAEEFFIHT